MVDQGFLTKPKLICDDSFCATQGGRGGSTDEIQFSSDCRNEIKNLIGISI